MAIYELDGQGPEFPADGNYFVADTATVIAKSGCSAAPASGSAAVLRGDNEWIEIGEGSNVQDGSTCHTDPGFPLTIGKNCTVGHNVILHGCTLEDGALVGMGSIVMNGARIGPRQCGRRGSGHHRRQAVSREFADHRRAGAGDPCAGSRPGRPDGAARQILPAQRPAFQKRLEENRLEARNLRCPRTHRLRWRLRPARVRPPTAACSWLPS